MATMKIGIIGAGNIGGNLTRRLTALGHNVSVANSRGPDSLWSLVHETGAQAVTVPEAVQDKDLVIVTIQHSEPAEGPLCERWRERCRAGHRQLLSTATRRTHRRNRRQRLTQSRWVEHQLGHPVMKAFNNIYAAHLLSNGKPKGTPERVALPVAGDDARAKKIVMDLVDQLGFDPVDDGGIADSWRQQPGTPVYAQDFDAHGVRRALAEASKERKPEWRAIKAGVS